MTTVASEPVRVSNGEVRLSLTVSSRSLAEYFEPVHPPDRPGEAARLLHLGLDTARRIDQSAEQAALGDVRDSLVTALGELHDRLSASMQHLGTMASTAGDRLSAHTDKLATTVSDQIRSMPDQVREAVAGATSDVDLAGIVSEILTGAGSPIEQLEQRIADSLDQAKESQDAALSAAVSQLTAASTALGWLRGATEQRDKSPSGGLDYETAVENHLAVAASRRGGVLADVRHRPGNGGSKKGDYLVDISEGSRSARVAVELKRTAAGMSAEAAEALVDAVVDARDADAVLVVCAFAEGMPAGLRNGGTLGAVGSKGLAVCFPAEGDPAVLDVAYALARVMAVQASRSKDGANGVDPEALDEMIGQAKRGLGSIRNVERALNRVRNELTSQVKALTNHRQAIAADLEGVLTILAGGRP